MSHLLRAVVCGMALAALDVEEIAAQQPDLVEIQAVDPTIVTELRYAGARNIAQHPLYPADMKAELERAVAFQLRTAQSYLRQEGYGLKIWDAYRPRTVQDELSRLCPDKNYMADPGAAPGSMHSWGLAVDATLVNRARAELTMPTDFDEFTLAAMLRYSGTDPAIRRHLITLQHAMARAGFLGMRTEWWHFVTKNWARYVPRTAIGQFDVSENAARHAP